MRTLALGIAFLGLLGSPLTASAQASSGEHGSTAARHAGRGGRGSPRTTAPSPGQHAVRPAPPRYAPRYGPIAPRPLRFVPRYAFDPWFYGFAPVWWGWGWGYGYYPLYPRPEYGYAPEDVHRVVTRLQVVGGGTLHRGGGNAGLALGVEGDRLGFHLGIDGFYPGRRPGFGGGSVFDSSTSYGLFTGHLTAALLGNDVARLRAEVGASVFSFPDASPDAGLVSFGPDVGVSGQLGLAGPLGLEAYARVTPVPIPIIDVEAALALRFGPVAVKAGWRELSVRKTDRNLSTFAYAGPQAGLAFRF
jgi:hypothetical protein